jgi:hypothetical protein
MAASRTMTSSGNSHSKKPERGESRLSVALPSQNTAMGLAATAARLMAPEHEIAGVACQLRIDALAGDCTLSVVRGLRSS